MALPANNLFNLEAPLLARLDTLKVEAPTLHTGAAITLVGITNVASYMPGIFVRPAKSDGAEDVGGQVQEWQHWEVICGVQTIADKHGLSTTYAALGALAHRVLLLLHDWPSPVGNLMYTGRDEVLEHSGYAELALNFAVPLLVDLSAGGSLDDFLRFYPTYDVEDADSTSNDRINLPGPETAPP
ncbi:MAG: hypothetical protein PF501_09900 [Salinisphaera sp.]|jgi:hypothetical protein|nr:hypothetical protein [Salinisphaera sp.]